MTSPGAASRVSELLTRFEALHPRVIDLSLGRIKRLLGRLRHPERRLPPAVHVAGTNGKGSTVAFLRAALEAAGYRAHAYTSPHLVRFNERIVLAGREIGDEALISALEACETANDGADITFFEITTAAALLAFADTPADILLLETGLGGRLDATNVVDAPRLCAITPIAHDHHQYLGETLAEIAGEKAGILKPDVCAAVGPQPMEALRSIEASAAAVGAPLHRYGREWTLSAQRGAARYESNHLAFELPALPLPGRHQIDNAGLAVASLDLLTKSSPGAAYSIDGPAMRAGLSGARWPGRLERLRDGPLAALLPAGWELWLDGGHNPAAGQALADWAALDDRPLHVVAGMLATKDAAGFLAPLAALAASVHAVPVPGAHTSMTPDAMAGLADRVGVRLTVHDDCAAAIRHLSNGARGRARVLICGSLYLVGAVLGETRQQIR